MYKVSIQKAFVYPLIASVTLLWITGCSDTEHHPAESSQKPTKITTTLHRQPETMAVDQLESETPQPAVLLDLNPVDPAIEPTTTLPASHREEPALLPNLFEEQPENSRAHLSGRLITDEKNDDLIESIEGIEISIDIQTR